MGDVLLQKAIRKNKVVGYRIVVGKKSISTHKTIRVAEKRFRSEIRKQKKKGFNMGKVITLGKKKKTKRR